MNIIFYRGLDDVIVGRVVDLGGVSERNFCKNIRTYSPNLITRQVHLQSEHFDVTDVFEVRTQCPRHDRSSPLYIFSPMVFIFTSVRFTSALWVESLCYNPAPVAVLLIKAAQPISSWVKGQLLQAGDNRGAALCELGERLRSIQEELRGTPRLTPAEYQPSGKPRGWPPLPDQLDCTPTPPPTPPPSFLPPFPQLGNTPNPPSNEIPPPLPNSAGTLLPSAAPRGTLNRTKESYLSELPTHQPLTSHHPAPRGPDGYVQQPHAWDTRPWQPPQPYRNRPWQRNQRQGYRHPGWVNPRFLPCTACDELGHRTRECDYLPNGPKYGKIPPRKRS
ncbi:unnamed protein product, partial [Nesidiocoris tenuis]